MSGNGRHTLNIKGVKYPLYFNMPACEEFTNRVSEKKRLDVEFKVVVDLIYCGMLGYSISANEPIPEYSTAYDVADMLYDEDDFEKQIQSANKIFLHSKSNTFNETNSADSERDEQSDIDSYWHNVRKYCLGFIGMTLSEYNNTTYSDLMRKIDGFNERLKTNLSLKRHHAWITYISPHLDPKKMSKSIDEFWPQSPENATSSKKIDDEKRQRIKAFLEKRQHDKQN